MLKGSLELKLISEILRQRNFAPCIKQTIGVDHFTDPDAAKVFEIIRLHYQSRDTRKTIPSIQSIRKRVPGFRMIPKADDDPELAAMVKQLKIEKLSTDLGSISDTVKEIVQNNEPEDALEFLKKQIGRISYHHEGSSGMRMEDVIASVFEQHDNALTGEAYGIPWTWDCLTRDTMGKKPGDLIFIYGRAKSMKTWVALKTAMDDYLVHKQRVLFWSREMSKNNMAMRIGSIAAGVDYQLLKRGMLPAPVWDKARDKLLNLKEAIERSPEVKKERKDRNQDDLFIFCGSQAPREFQELQGVIDETEPDIVVMDSFYHMTPTRSGKSDHERIRYLIEDMKQLAVEIEKPVILIHQANREGEKTFGDTMTDFARSDAAAAECDLAIRVIRKKVSEIYEPEYEGYWDRAVKDLQNIRKKRGIQLNNKAPVPEDVKVKNRDPNTIQVPDYERTKAELALMMAGTRDGVLDGFVIEANPGYNFNVIKESVTPEEVREWLSQEPKLANEEKKREQNNELDHQESRQKMKRASRGGRDKIKKDGVVRGKFEDTI